MVKLVPLSIQTQQVVFGTVRNLLGAFIVDRQARALSKGTVCYYQEELDRFCNWLDSIGVVNLDEITPDVIKKYLLQLAVTRNPGGCHAGFRAIRAFLNWYEGEFEMEGWKNPVKKVHPPKVSRQPLPGVPVEDIHKMVASCHTEQAQRDKAILLTLLDTGCRATELIRLRQFYSLC